MSRKILLFLGLLSLSQSFIVHSSQDPEQRLAKTIQTIESELHQFASERRNLRNSPQFTLPLVPFFAQVIRFAGMPPQDQNYRDFQQMLEKIIVLDRNFIDHYSDLMMHKKIVPADFQGVPRTIYVPASAIGPKLLAIALEPALDSRRKVEILSNLYNTLLGAVENSGYLSSPAIRKLNQYPDLETLLTPAWLESHRTQGYIVPYLTALGLLDAYNEIFNPKAAKTGTSASAVPAPTAGGGSGASVAATVGKEKESAPALGVSLTRTAAPASSPKPAPTAGSSPKQSAIKTASQGSASARAVPATRHATAAAPAAPAARGLTITTATAGGKIFNPLEHFQKLSNMLYSISRRNIESSIGYLQEKKQEFRFLIDVLSNFIDENQDLAGRIRLSEFKPNVIYIFRYLNDFLDKIDKNPLIGDDLILVQDYLRGAYGMLDKYAKTFHGFNVEHPESITILSRVRKQFEARKEPTPVVATSATAASASQAGESIAPTQTQVASPLPEVAQEQTPEPAPAQYYAVPAVEPSHSFGEGTSAPRRPAPKDTVASLFGLSESSVGAPARALQEAEQPATSTASRALTRTANPDIYSMFGMSKRKAPWSKGHAQAAGYIREGKYDQAIPVIQDGRLDSTAEEPGTGKTLRAIASDIQKEAFAKDIDLTEDENWRTLNYLLMSV